MKFSDAETGYVYLLRAYEAQGVDVDHRDNTYIELFSARNPHELELLRIVDRSFIHAKTLSISDIKVYMNDIYFIDYVNGLYRLDVLKNQHLLVRGRYNKEGFYKFSTYSNNL